MAKESNLIPSIYFLSGSVLSGGAYLAPFHLHPSAASALLYFAIFFGSIGLVKLIHSFSKRFPKPLRRTVCWIHSLVFEAFAVALTFLLRPLGYLTDQSVSTGPSDGRPILLVHGYLHDSSAWIYLKRELRKSGFGPIYTLNLKHPFRSIRDYAAQVAKKAEGIAKQRGRSDLLLIGHSMGGLVSSWYASKIAPPRKKLEVITIGSPLNGTYAAAIAIGRNGREMCRGSEFIKELQQEIGKSRIGFYHIASMADQLILPGSSGRTGRNPDREYILEDIGHMTLLLSPRVAKKIEWWLGS